MLGRLCGKENDMHNFQISMIDNVPFALCSFPNVQFYIACIPTVSHKIDFDVIRNNKTG